MIIDSRNADYSDEAPSVSLSSPRGAPLISFRSMPARVRGREEYTYPLRHRSTYRRFEFHRANIARSIFSAMRLAFTVDA